MLLSHSTHANSTEQAIQLAIDGSVDFAVGALFDLFAGAFAALLDALAGGFAPQNRYKGERGDD